MTNRQQLGPLELRDFSPPREADEIVSNEPVDLHLERMDEDAVWMGITHEGKTYAVDFWIEPPTWFPERLWDWLTDLDRDPKHRFAIAMRCEER